MCMLLRTPTHGQAAALVDEAEAPGDASLPGLPEAPQSASPDATQWNWLSGPPSGSGKSAPCSYHELARDCLVPQDLLDNLFGDQVGCSRRPTAMGSSAAGCGCAGTPAGARGSPWGRARSAARPRRPSHSALRCQACA